MKGKSGKAKLVLVYVGLRVPIWVPGTEYDRMIKAGHAATWPAVRDRVMLELTLEGEKCWNIVKLG